MKMLLTICLTLVAANSFADTILTVGSSANINGEVVSCEPGRGVPESATKCDCNGLYGKIGEVVISPGASSVDECHKISSEASPSSCASFPTRNGSYTCDCNGLYGKVGDVTIARGLSAVGECHKISSEATPSNCSAR